MRALERSLEKNMEIYDSIRAAFKRGEYDPTIFYSSSDNMKEVKDNSVQLIVTSPPYNVGKDYGVYNDSKLRNVYLDYLDTIWVECRRVLCNGGRIAVNVANIDRKPYKFLSGDITTRLIENHDFMMRGDIIWDKGASVGVSTAWGSWRSGSNPTLRDVHEQILVFGKEPLETIHEHILVFSKDQWKLDSDKKISTISPKDFCRNTRSIWEMKTANGLANSHPAPFPEELPKRLIQLYTHVGDTVLDPFVGSGTTCVVAKSLARKSIGYEIDPMYKEVIESRISSVTQLDVNPEDIKINNKAVKGLKTH